MRVLLVVVALAYFFPAIKFLLFLLRKLFFLRPMALKAETSKSNLFKIFYAISCLEYLISPVRYCLIGIPFLFGFIVLSLTILFGFIDMSLPIYMAALFLSFLVIWTRVAKSITDLKATEFLRVSENIHPQNFYNRYKLDLAFGGIDFLSSADIEIVSPTKIDFKKGKRPKQKLIIFLRTVVDTAYIAHLCLHIYKKMGPIYLNEVVDKIGWLWGKRILQLSHGKFSIYGEEKLNHKKGKFLLIFNHKSSFDFVLAYFAFSQIRVNGRIVAPRFILAKDHFKDNWLIYRFFGVGKVCEIIHMVFLTRHNQKKSFEELKLAAKNIVENEIDVAIYPQGTRAPGNFDRALKRRDAGYYTTISKKSLSAPLSHLKKGTGYLIYDTLSELYENGDTRDLNLVFVGIQGAANAFPKGYYKIQTETDIQFKIGNVVTLSPSIVAEIQESAKNNGSVNHRKEFIKDMNLMINNNLVSVLDLHTKLRQRYLTELKGQFRFENDKIEAIESYLKELSQESDVVYQVLDRIYSLPLSLWNGYLSQLGQFLLEKSDTARLQTFLDEVSLDLIKNQR